MLPVPGLVLSVLESVLSVPGSVPAVLGSVLEPELEISLYSIHMRSHVCVTEACPCHVDRYNAHRQESQEVSSASDVRGGRRRARRHRHDSDQSTHGRQKPDQSTHSRQKPDQSGEKVGAEERNSANKDIDSDELVKQLQTVSSAISMT